LNGQIADMKDAGMFRQINDARTDRPSKSE